MNTCNTTCTSIACSRPQVDDLMYELSRSLRSTFAVTMLLGMEDRLMAYAEETEDKTPTAMKLEDFEWRNGEQNTSRIG
jgi:hypothetical protein